MLDTQTKSRIDSARDILVGKVPDPKSQVEQITIALIYKFMDDMDRQTEELGGKATFFTGEFKKYRWAQLLDKRYGGHERLLLYAEGIEKMNENKNIPQLFRDIFRGVFLPYRDPETLNLFLKEINGFSYDHSERLGDAFEYLLSILGTQGDAGQFRTPRHIIDFIVSVVDPKKDETILDPACGTAGFLISAYKHIMNCGLQIEDCGLNGKQSATSNQKSKIPHSLSPDERARLMTNFRGYDIAPDMVRLARANLYLHGFPNPTIHEYDTLASEERWDERCDVILANPPFMTPKGGVRPHNRFSIKAKRSEVLFVDYIAEHLNPGGRAGIIVPEGIIFQGGNAYRKLREMLIRDSLIAVISLPSGVFMPYTGVKTSILILDRAIAKRIPRVLFSEVKHIGFSLGVKRTPSENNDLPLVLHDYETFCSEGAELSRCSCIASRDIVLANGSILTGSRYRPTIASGIKQLVSIGEVCEITKGVYSSTKTPPGPYPLILTASEPKTAAEYQLAGSSVCVPLISSLGHGKAALHRIHFVNGKFALANLLVALLPKDSSQLNANYLYYALDAKRDDIAGLMRGAANVSMKPEDLAQFQFPLPPLDEQERIVAELEGYRKVIEGARQILAAYKPTICIDHAWPMMKLGEVCAINPETVNPEVSYPNQSIFYIDISAVENGTGRFMGYSEVPSAEAPSRARRAVRSGDVLLSTVRPNLKAFTLLEDVRERAVASTGFAVLRSREELLDPVFLLNYVFTDSASNKWSE